MKGGFCGKILAVDLTEEKTSEITISEDVLRKYLGGWGLALRILYNELPPGISPLDPENPLS